MPRITSSSEALEQLRIDPEAIVAQARYYASYARMLERARSVSPTRVDDANVWTRLAHPTQEWLGGATIASTYRLASQYAALFDVPLAMRLATRASLAYLEEGLPFGAFLAAGLLGDQVLRHSDVTPRLTGLMSRLAAQPASADPVQQTYLLLTMASRPWLRDLVEQPISDMLAHLRVHGLHPVGPQSAPLATYLDVARTMLTPPDRVDVEAQPTELPTMALQLADVGRAQAASLRRTMRNGYLWRHAAAPANLIDLEQVALFGLAMRSGSLWSHRILAQTEEELEGSDPLADLTGWACDEMQRAQAENGLTAELVRILGTYSWHRTPRADR
jgi:hypothetical protein